MKVQFKHLAAVMAISTSLLSAVPAMADEVQQASPAASAPLAVQSYELGNGLQVQVLGVLSEKSSSGVRLGAAVRIINTNADTVRIPDHELRLKSADGLVYTVTPSSANVHGVPGQSQVDLTYLRQLDRKKDLKITDLSLVDVNYDVYPKMETPLVSVSVASQVWNGSRGVISEPAAMKKWDETFAVPTLDSPLTYTPVSISKSYTNQGATYLVKLRVNNATDQTETVPAFEVGGKTQSNSYPGVRAETGNVTLQPGDTTYIHYVIQTELDSELDTLNILATETYVAAVASGSAKPTTFGIGKLNLALPATVTSAAYGAEYKYGEAIAFEPSNGFVNPNLQVSLVELHATDSLENGYRTAFAKLKLENKSDNPIPVPALQTELVSQSGSGGSYNGTRQTATLASVQPGTTAVVSYAFTLPTSEDSSSFSLKVQGTVQSDPSALAYRSTIAALPVSVQADDDHNQVHLYPYTLNFKSWILSPIMLNWSTYTYKLHLDMDITRDPQVVLDNNFSTLKIELVDEIGGTLGAKYFPFTGANRIVNGDQTLVFTGITSDQARQNLTVKVSESIMTPNGEMNRVIAQLKP